jgi:AraC-like DNA-binding protein
VSVLTAEFEDPDCFAAAVPGGRYGVVPLDGRKFRASVADIAVGSELAVRRATTQGDVILRSEFDGGAVAFILPSLDGAGAVLDGQDAQHLTVAPRLPGDTPTLRSYGALSAGGLTFSKSYLEQEASRLTGADSSAVVSGQIRLLQGTPEHLAGLSALHRQICLGAWQFGNNSQVATGFFQLRDDVMLLIAHLLQPHRAERDLTKPRSRTAAMRRVERFLDDNVGAPLSLTAVSAGTALSARTLERIVRERTGLSAIAYFRRRRLALARKILLQRGPHASVTDVALEVGFLHLSRFADAYRKVYGELPSETRRRGLTGRNGNWQESDSAVLFLR